MGKNPLRTGIRSLKAGSRKIRKDYNASVSRALHLAGISGAWNILLGLGKIISGLLSFSGFVCVSGFYTLGMVFARYCALAGVVQAKNVKEQYRCLVYNKNTQNCRGDSPKLQKEIPQ